MSGNGKRKWSAEEKLRIVLAGMQPGVEVSDLCRREGLNPNLYYLWKKQLLSSAGKIFEAKAGRPPLTRLHAFSPSAAGKHLALPTNRLRASVGSPAGFRTGARRGRFQRTRP